MLVAHIHFSYSFLTSFLPLREKKNRLDKEDKNARSLERMKWHQQSVVNRRMEVAYGAYATPPPKPPILPDPNNIWRDSWSRDAPLPLGGGGGGGRGTKRKGAGRSAVDGGAGGGRNVRRRATRKQKNSLSNLA